MAAQSGESSSRLWLTDFGQDDATIGCALEIDLAPGFDFHQVPNSLGNGDLASTVDDNAHDDLMDAVVLNVAKDLMPSNACPLLLSS